MLDLEEVDLIQEIDTLVQEGDEEESSNQTGRQTIRPAKRVSFMLVTIKSRKGWKQDGN